jgi:ankyrin repeat protein
MRLHFAINARCLADVQQLISDGIDLSFAAPTNGQTPLTLSILTQQHEIALVLIDAGADVSVAESTTWHRQPIHLAAAAGRSDIVGAILKRSPASVSATDAMLFTALHHAAVAGNGDVAKILVAAGARVGARDDRGRTSLFRAVEYRNFAVVDVLLEAGCSFDTVDVFGWTPIYHAAVCGQVDMVQYLLDRGADVDGNGVMTPLHAASGVVATEETLGVLRYTGVDYYLRRCRAMTPLVHQAVSVSLLSGGRTCYELAAMLVDHGADVNRPDGKGSSALQLAAVSGRSEIVKLLISAGACVGAEQWIAEQRWPDAIAVDVETCEFLRQMALIRVPRLDDICRLVIRRILCRRIAEKIDRLPVPSKLKTFIKI